MKAKPFTRSKASKSNFSQNINETKGERLKTIAIIDNQSRKDDAE